MYGRISDPEMTTYPPQVALALRTPGWDLASSQWGWGFHTVRGGIDPGDHHFRPRFVELYIYIHGKIHDAGTDPYPPRAALALQTPG